MTDFYVAREDIPFGSVFAHRRGDSVPADNVKANGWEDLVVGPNTKAAHEIKAEITGRPVSDFETTTAPTPARRGTAGAGQEG